MEMLFSERQVVLAGARSKWSRARNLALGDLVHERWVLPPADSIAGFHYAIKADEVFDTHRSRIVRAVAMPDASPRRDNSSSQSSFRGRLRLWKLTALLERTTRRAQSRIGINSSDRNPRLIRFTVNFQPD